MLRLNNVEQVEPQGVLADVADAWEGIRPGYEAKAHAVRAERSSRGYCGPGSYALARIASQHTGDMQAVFDQEIGGDGTKMVLGLEKGIPIPDELPDPHNDHAWVEVHADGQVVLANPIRDPNSPEASFEVTCVPVEKLPQLYARMGLRRTDPDELRAKGVNVSPFLRAAVPQYLALVEQINVGQVPDVYAEQIIPEVLDL